MTETTTTPGNAPSTVLLVILAILLPPLAVGLSRGITGQFWLNLVLTILGFWILGVIHALFLILS